MRLLIVKEDGIRLFIPTSYPVLKRSIVVAIWYAQNRRRNLVALALAATFTMTTIVAPTAADVLSATPETIAVATLDFTPATASSSLGFSPGIFFDDITGIYYL